MPRVLQTQEQNPVSRGPGARAPEQPAPAAPADPPGPVEPLGPVELPEPDVVDVPEPGIVEVPERVAQDYLNQATLVREPQMVSAAVQRRGGAVAPGPRPTGGE
jgi:hypothetical protein